MDKSETPAASATTREQASSFDVFISHSSKDETTADATCHALESRGIRCWIASRDIRPGANWGESIVGAISSVRIMVLLLSRNANASPQIQREVERAVHHRVIIIQMRIEEVMPAASLEYFLSTSQWLDAFRPPLDAHLQRLADTVQSLLGQTVEQPMPPAVRPSGRRWSGPVIIGGMVLAGAAAVFLWWQFEHWHEPLSRIAVPADDFSHPAVRSTVPLTRIVSPTPSPATVADFVGSWEISQINLDDGAGNQAFYGPVRFTVSADGQIVGKASLTMEMQGGKPRSLQPPRVTTLSGTVSLPQNKKHEANGSMLDANGFCHEAAAIEFKLSDGIEGKGSIGLTEGLPVVEFITMSKGAMTGKMYAAKQ